MTAWNYRVTASNRCSAAGLGGILLKRGQLWCWVAQLQRGGVEVACRNGRVLGAISACEILAIDVLHHPVERPVGMQCTVGTNHVPMIDIDKHL